MKKFNKTALSILCWITTSMLVLYFKWAAQKTTSLPGLPSPESESIFEIILNNTDVIVVALLGSIPIFYLSLYYLTPKLLFNRSFIRITLFAASVTAYFIAVILVTNFVFPMYYFFGIPFAIKVLAPIVLLSALGGTLLAYMEECQKVIIENKVKENVRLRLD